MHSLTHANYRLLALLLLLPLLAACTPPAAVMISTPTTAATASAAPTAAPAATQPAPDTPVYYFENIRLNLDPTLFAFASGQVIAKQPSGPDTPFWMVHPEVIRVTLAGYPVTHSVFSPEIAVYAVEETRALSEPGAQAVDGLRQFLAERPVDIEQIPALPLRNALQAMHAKTAFLNFQNGSGARFLAFYSQGMVTVSNAEIFYTYQGLTDDGRYYVSVVMPVNHPDLPAEGKTPTLSEYEMLFKDGKYYADTAAALEAQPDSSFTPELAKLDALVESIRIGE